VFKKAFHLSQAQSMYVAMAFYVAYTAGSLIYIAVSRAIGTDVLHRVGYRNGISACWSRHWAPCSSIRRPTPARLH
jgi:fucose permease